MEGGQFRMRGCGNQHKGVAVGVQGGKFRMRVLSKRWGVQNEVF